MKLELVATPDVPALDVNVDTTDRVVTLFGIVRTADERSRAEQVALGVTPVREVENHLLVVPESAEAGATVPDEQIRAAVEMALVADPALRDAEIEVVVVDGIVELSGSASSEFDRVRVLREARAVDGVRAVAAATERQRPLLRLGPAARLPGRARNGAYARGAVPPDDAGKDRATRGGGKVETPNFDAGLEIFLLPFVGSILAGNGQGRLPA